MDSKHTLLIKVPKPDSDSDSEADSEAMLSCTRVAAVAFLTVNTLIGAVRARGDVWTLSFIISTYVALMLLFWCLKVFDGLPEKCARRERMKVAVWSLSTALNIMFAYGVSVVLCWEMAWLVWSLPTLSSCFTFYLFFLYKDSNSSSCNTTDCSNWKHPLPLLEP